MTSIYLAEIDNGNVGNAQFVKLDKSKKYEVYFDDFTQKVIIREISKGNADNNSGIKVM